MRPKDKKLITEGKQEVTEITEALETSARRKLNFFGVRGQPGSLKIASIFGVVLASVLSVLSVINKRGVRGLPPTVVGR